MTLLEGGKKLICEEREQKIKEKNTVTYFDNRMS